MQAACRRGVVEAGGNMNICQDHLNISRNLHNYYVDIAGNRAYDGHDGRHVANRMLEIANAKDMVRCVVGAERLSY